MPSFESRSKEDKAKFPDDSDWQRLSDDFHLNFVIYRDNKGNGIADRSAAGRPNAPEYNVFKEKNGKYYPILINAGPVVRPAILDGADPRAFGEFDRNPVGGAIQGVKFDIPKVEIIGLNESIGTSLHKTFVKPVVNAASTVNEFRRGILTLKPPQSGKEAVAEEKRKIDNEKAAATRRASATKLLKEASEAAVRRKSTPAVEAAEDAVAASAWSQSVEENSPNIQQQDPEEARYLSQHIANLAKIKLDKEEEFMGQLPTKIEAEVAAASETENQKYKEAKEVRMRSQLPVQVPPVEVPPEASNPFNQFLPGADAAKEVRMRSQLPVQVPPVEVPPEASNPFNQFLPGADAAKEVRGGRRKTTTNWRRSKPVRYTRRKF